VRLPVLDEICGPELPTDADQIRERKVGVDGAIFISAFSIYRYDRSRGAGTRNPSRSRTLARSLRNQWFDRKP
jgi:hypothetical protein